MASLPHFYDAAMEYQTGVIGLNPSKEKHEILMVFEPVSVQSLGKTFCASRFASTNSPLGTSVCLDGESLLTSLLSDVMVVAIASGFNDKSQGKLIKFIPIIQVWAISRYFHCTHFETQKVKSVKRTANTVVLV